MSRAETLNRIKGSTRGLPEEAWRLGSDTETNRIKSLGRINNNKVVKFKNQITNECNKCRGNQPINNPIYGIADTGVTQN